MNQKAINYEILFFTNSRFLEKNICRKKCNNHNKICPFQLHHVVRRGKVFFNSLINFFEELSIEDSDSSLKIISAEKFIHISVGNTSEAEQAINPYSFLPLKYHN